MCRIPLIGYSCSSFWIESLLNNGTDSSRMASSIIIFCYKKLLVNITYKARFIQ
ncbi:hypothetical protein ACU8KH_03964 [Lachancea thermotolerans]